MRLKSKPPDRRFPKSRRLLRPAEFTAVMEAGRRWQDAFFSIYATPNRLDYARLGLIVGRRVSNKATVRNRIKRCVRESFRQEQARLGGCDIVVAARPAATRAEAAMLRAALTGHWDKITRLCKNS